MAPFDLPQFPHSEPIPQPPSSPPSIASDSRRARKPPSALRALTSPTVNRLGPTFSRTSKAGTRSPHDSLPEDFIRTPSRKRKNSFSSIGSPLQSSPLKRVRVRSPTSDVDHEIRIPDVDLRLQAAEAPVVPKQPPAVAPMRRSPTLPNLIKRYRPSLSRPKTNKQPMLPSSSDLSHPYRDRFLQRKNLFFPPTPYSQLKIFIFVSTINRHRSSSRIRQANAQSNELGTNPHPSLSYCPNS
ncbi:hypothetical protein N7449_012295 [Penicillium cf. viridicatum]|uniref:Uncharacterized protein n=1 Tax=Penicillium cf. viridicatum TaxID=2972119 RepID=A0A9W9IQ09_9EURO|nr:hypothetical protein N7449_012295 [Penicillium cf. viridicatum]